MSDDDFASAPPRVDLISTAVKFLKNPKVINSSAEQKRAFLKKKGLTDAEVDDAFAQVETVTLDHYVPPLRYSQIPVGPPSLWLQIRDVANVFVLMVGASYGLYAVYKHVLVKIFGPNAKSKEERLYEMCETLNNNVIKLQQSVEDLQMALVRHEQHVSSAVRNEMASVLPHGNLQEMRCDIAAVKGLLLSRHSFPPTPSNPSIPLWQLSQESNSSVPDDGHISPCSDLKDENLHVLTTSRESTNGQNSSSSCEVVFVSQSDGGADGGSDTSQESGDM